jgi:hypothetical protein
MKKIVTKLSVFALFLLLGLNACKDDDSDSCQNGTFEMTVDGEEVTGGDFNNTLVKANSAGTDGKRMDLRATDNQGRTLIITFTDLSTGKNGDGVSTDEYIPFDDISTGSENTFFFTLITDDVSYPFTDGTLDITSCDANAKQVSGTFSFSNDDIAVSNGSFTNMCYRVISQ